MQLQGTMQPHQIISLLDFGGNTLAMADHADHIHVGLPADVRREHASSASRRSRCSKPGQWYDLISRLGEIENPVVPTKPSKYALPADPKRSSQAHVGE